MAIHIHIHTKDAEVVPPQWGKFQQYMKKAWAAERGKESAQKKQNQGKPVTKSPQEFQGAISENFQQANLLLQQMNKEYPEFTKGFPANSSATGWLRLIK